MRSGSSSDWPGVIYLSRAQPFALAENLVHEACHQYFKVVTRVQRASAEHDGDAYHSPFVGRERPLEAIVLAFHAFGNARLFLHACRDHGDVPARWLRSRIDELDTKLAACEGHLVGNAALTPLGRALVAPLRGALTEARAA